MTTRVLVVAATHAEAAHVPEHLPVIVTGLGKTAAAVGVTEALVGVDLSPKMVEKARLRGDYDDLLITEITGYLRTRPSSFDLLVAADVFVYFGDLREVLAASAASLRPGGHYAFTLERCATGEDWHLNPHGRYSHGEDYLHRLAAEAGFRVVSIESVVPRHEGGQPVPGMLVVLTKD